LASHVAWSRWVLHFVVPVCGFVTQQATASGLPHVERAAHFLTAPLQVFGRDGVSPLESSFAARATQL